MAWDVITKRTAERRPAPNLRDYDAVREAFTWSAVRAELAMPGGLNIAYQALDRHVAEGRGDQLALRWLGKNGEKRDFTYRELLALSDRFANLLRGLGVGQGRAGLQPARPRSRALCRGARHPENGSVFSPLFSAFGPEPIAPAWRSARPRFWSPPPPSTGGRWPSGA